MTFNDDFLLRANHLLAEAERQADTPERRRRAAIFRLPVWFEMLENEFPRNGVLLTLPVEWDFLTDPDDHAVPAGAEFPDGGWLKIKTNDFWTMQNGSKEYRGTAWYKIDFESPQLQKEAAPAFYFGAVDGYCDIWLDNRKIGEQKLSPAVMWNKGFYINIPASLKPGRHTLTVKVRKNDKGKGGGIWKPVRLVDRNAALKPEVREAAERFMTTATEAGASYTSEFYGKPGLQLTEDFFPRINALLNRKAAEPSDRFFRHYPATKKNIHNTSKIIMDATAATGSCVLQNAGKWTLNQSISAGITEELNKAYDNGIKPVLCVRVKVKRHQNGTGTAFDFGLRTVKSDWSGKILMRKTISLKDCDGDWRIFSLGPLPNPAATKSSIYLRAADNPDLEAILVDYLELCPDDRQ